MVISSWMFSFDCCRLLCDVTHALEESCGWQLGFLTAGHAVVISVKRVGRGLVGIGALAGVGCGAQVSICTPGEQASCSCPGAAQSVQVCGDDEAFGPCRCDEVDTSGGGVGPGLPAGSSSLSDSSQPLLELFDGGEVLYVVLRDAVSAVTRDGEVVASWSSGFDIGTAAWDGQRLVLADEMGVRVLDSDLGLRAEGAVAAPCDDSVLVPGPYFVCMEVAPEPRFFVYDALTAGPVSESEPFAFVGRRMHAVPDTGDFFTIAVPDPDMTLFRVSSNGGVSLVGESALGSSESMSDVVAVDDDQGGRVVGHKGRSYGIYEPDCDPVLGSQSTCFGESGSYDLPGQGFYYHAMHLTDHGTLYGLTNRVEGAYQACGNGWSCPVCTGGCRIHRAVLAGEHVVAVQEMGEGVMSPGAFVLPDPSGEAVILGYNRVPAAPGESSPGHRVVRIPF